jgi:hypothetical protein
VAYRPPGLQLPLFFMHVWCQRFYIVREGHKIRKKRTIRATVSQNHPHLFNHPFYKRRKAKFKVALHYVIFSTNLCYFTSPYAQNIPSTTCSENRQI